jgi:hypothetical protein
MTPGPSETDRGPFRGIAVSLTSVYPELIHQMVLERTARFQRDADRYRQARETYIRPPHPLRTAIELRLSARREELERLARRRGAAGRSTE